MSCGGPIIMPGMTTLLSPLSLRITSMSVLSLSLPTCSFP
ncbi:hypothetical protein [Sphingobacterium sp. T2]|nr:hypothetical protein [Sphingobacterium sp. T2]